MADVEALVEGLKPLAGRFAAKGWGGIESTLFRVTCDEAADFVKLLRALSSPDLEVEEQGFSSTRDHNHTVTGGAGTPASPIDVARLAVALDALPEVAVALARGWKFNAYERVCGGYYVSLGPITNRHIALAVADDEDAAELLVAALRVALRDGAPSRPPVIDSDSPQAPAGVGG